MHNNICPISESYTGSYLGHGRWVFRRNLFRGEIQHTNYRRSFVHYHNNRCLYVFILFCSTKITRNCQRKTWQNRFWQKVDDVHNLYLHLFASLYLSLFCWKSFLFYFPRSRFTNGEEYAILGRNISILKFICECMYNFL